MSAIAVQKLGYEKKRRAGKPGEGGSAASGSRHRHVLAPSGGASTSTDVTFASVELETAFDEFCRSRVASVADESIASWRKRLGLDELEAIENQEFLAANAERIILDGVLLGTGLPATKPTRGGRPLDLPAHLARLCEAKLLTPDEEFQLFRRMNFLRHLAVRLCKELESSPVSEHQRRRIEGLVHAANWYRDTIVRANMRLVISIVKKFVNAYNLFDDLLSDGIMALIRAVDKFDYDRGFRFSTYATQVVRRNAYRNVMSKQKERAHLGVSLQEAEIDVCDRENNSSLSIDRWNDLRNRLRVLLDQLDRREKLIVRARFSLGGHRRVQTLQHLADRLGVSKERVRQLEKRALDKLHSMASRVELAAIEI